MLGVGDLGCMPFDGTKVDNVGFVCVGLGEGPGVGTAGVRYFAGGKKGRHRGVATNEWNEEEIKEEECRYRSHTASCMNSKVTWERWPSKDEEAKMTGWLHCLIHTATFDGGQHLASSVMRHSWWPSSSPTNNLCSSRSADNKPSFVHVENVLR